MTTPPPDGSRDRRIEDPTNLWIIHPAGRRLLPWAIARGISANSVSVVGLILGALAAAAYANWHNWSFVVLGLFLSTGWLIADGLDGMIARATGTASALGRALDGICDHGVFALLYVALAWSIGTPQGWILATAAGVAHAVQSSLYEGERTRFHRRCKGLPAAKPEPSRNPLVRLYDFVAGSIDRIAFRFDAALAQSPDPVAFGRAYGEAAAAPMGLMRLLTANVRVLAIFLACNSADPRLFFWFELLPLTVILIAGLVWHRHVETRLLRSAGAASLTSQSPIQRT
ncbi:CDP-alcohol phosphatidyltransferase family protein [Sphingomonas psychrotolerans]|uniref:CDP-alcohol phosphatidyltransferase family protein n=1 Tax=Sphingomonas psychrotolerans TaxID=1327635 RepID=A0ABU3N7K7_9SPHN|nr:CDP-alcohol phosphatidyltransferase family protein [Sphingomonas psychrotolerans]MDT8759466.1 CDP-alcohol phosphatidyltransferase family protein [Sphingomonas psychrotolerans]